MSKFTVEGYNWYYASRYSVGVKSSQVEVVVEATSEEEAIKKAKAAIKREGFTIKRIEL